MAHIVIYVGAIGPAASGDDIRYEGNARLSGMSSSDPDISWSVNVDASELAATVNGAIRDAAIAAAEAAEYTVGPTDKKTIMAGAVGL